MPEKGLSRSLLLHGHKQNSGRYNKISFVKVVGAMEALNVQKSDAAEWYGNQ